MTRGDAIRIEPWDEHNRALVGNVHPPGWVNPRPASRHNLVVIGAGTAGLVTAIGAAGLGAKVALQHGPVHAGEMLPDLTLAVAHGLGLAKIAETIHTYPTRAEAIRKLGDAWNRARLTPRVRRAFRAWFRWTR